MERTRPWVALMLAIMVVIGLVLGLHYTPIAIRNDITDLQKSTRRLAEETAELRNKDKELDRNRWENTKKIVALEVANRDKDKAEAIQELTGLISELQADTLALNKMVKEMQAKKPMQTMKVVVDGDCLKTVTGKKVYWLDFDGKDGKKHVVLPMWYSEGKEAQAMLSDKLIEAWKSGHPGVWRLEYDYPALLQGKFKDCVIETK